MRFHILLSLGLVLVGCQSQPRPDLKSDISRTAPGPVLPIPGVDREQQRFEARYLDFLSNNLLASRRMAREALREDSAPHVKQMADRAVKEYTPLLDQMSAFRRSLYAKIPPVPAHELEGSHIGPMMVPGGGESYDERWIETMISQHRAAIALCRKFIEQSQQVEIKNIAARVVRLHSRDLVDLERWLTNLRNGRA
jgi:uncharacterized protein (DUF305 family)